MEKNKIGKLGIVYQGKWNGCTIIAKSPKHYDPAFAEDFYNRPEEVDTIILCEISSGIFVTKVKEHYSFKVSDVKKITEIPLRTLSFCEDFDIELNNGEKFRALIEHDSFIEGYYKPYTLGFFREIFHDALTAPDPTQG